ncbi:hypothetical protein KC968_02765, partial [Candidatus Saccharibacteria bacterium]|nr:hypothetical protein [Candidatus Saccharibacteria bacterium]
KHFVKELEQKIEEQQAIIANLEKRLANKAYVKNAPKHIVEQTRGQLESTKATLEKTKQEYDRFAR